MVFQRQRSEGEVDSVTLCSLNDPGTVSAVWIGTREVWTLNHAAVAGQADMVAIWWTDGGEKTIFQLPVHVQTRV